MDGDESTKDIGFMTATEIQIETESLKRENAAYEELLRERQRRVELQSRLADDTAAKTAIAVRVGMEFGISLGELIGPQRREKIVIARHAAMALMYERFPDISLEAVGRFFGNRDHGTVLHAIKANKDRCEVNKDIKEKVGRCRDAISPSGVYVSIVSE
jgi:chromosomal replication initiation ATPase DnaA